MSAAPRAGQHAWRVPAPRHRRRKAAPRVPAARGAILGVMASRVTSTTFVGRTTELEELRGALTRGRRRPPVAGVRGRRVRRRQDAAAGRARARGPRGRHPRDRRRLRRAGGGRAALRADRRRAAPAGPRRRPGVRSSSRDAARCALAQILPGLGETPRATTRRPPRRACSTACSSCWSCSRARTACWSRSRTCTGPTARRARSSSTSRARCAASGCCVVTTYRPDELHRRHPLRPLLAELERDARHRRVELRPLTRDELGQQLSDILGDAPADDLLDAPVRAQRGQPAVRRGAAGRGHRRPRLAAADAARRADAADRAALRRRAGDCCGCSPRAAGSTTRSSPTRRASTRARCATRCARRSPRSSSSPTRRAATCSATRCCARSSSTTCCPASGRTMHLALARALEQRAEGLPAHGGAHLAAGIAHHYLASGDQPKALVAQRPRRRGRRGRARQRRGRRALLARAEAVGPRDGRRGAGRPRPRQPAARRRRDDRQASTSPRAPRPTCAPRWRSSATRDPVRAADLLEHVARKQFNQGRSARRRRDAPRGARPAPGRAEQGARDAARQRGQGADARVAPRRGGRGRAGGARGGPRRRRRGRRAARAGRHWACRCSGSPATRRARRSLREALARMRERGPDALHVLARQLRRRAVRRRPAGGGARDRRRGRRARRRARARRGAG